VLVVGITLVTIFGIGIWVLAPQLCPQIGQLTDMLPRSIQSLQQRLQQHSLGRWLLSHPAPLSDLLPGRSFLGKVTRIFSTTFGALAGLIVFLAVGLYLALDPALYTAGVICIEDTLGEGQCAAAMALTPLSLAPASASL
jgi:predicted PurR-regulated permease PerM